MGGSQHDLPSGTKEQIFYYVWMITLASDSILKIITSGEPKA